MGNSQTDSARKAKKRIGYIAIAMLILFTVLALIRILSTLEWIILDLIVALVANIMLRRVGKSQNRFD
jgi:lysylphosphatidylglycerol synthetase-like protein (DUF2156 family)